MKKLQKKKITKLLHYNLILKHNSLKLSFQNILYENFILLKNKTLNINLVEINQYKTIFLNNLNYNYLIYTIKKKFKNQNLFYFNLNYLLIYYFNKLIFKNLINKNLQIKGRVIGGNNEYIYIYIFGLIYTMIPKELNTLCNLKKKTFNFNKLKKKGCYSFFKIIRAKQIIQSYKLRQLTFNLEFLTINFFKKIILSRTAYISKILKNKEFKYNLYNLKKKDFSRKVHVLLEINKKKK
jgi:hypothetical protein